MVKYSQSSSITKAGHQLLPLCKRQVYKTQKKQWINKPFPGLPQRILHKIIIRIELCQKINLAVEIAAPKLLSGNLN